MSLKEKIYDLLAEETTQKFLSRNQGEVDCYALRKFEKRLAELATADASDWESIRKIVENPSEQVMGDHVDVLNVLHLAASIGYRRLKELDKSEACLRAINASGSKALDVLVVHLESLLYLEGSGRFDDYTRALELSDKVFFVCPESPGILHARARLKLLQSIWGDEEHDGTARDLLDDAERLVKLAIQIEDYPKFHFTRGQILARQADSRIKAKKAQREFVIAISNESNSADREQRVRDYELELSLLELRVNENMGLSGMENKMSRIVAESTEKFHGDLSEVFGRAQQSQILTLGFFTSILGILQFSAGLIVLSSEADVVGSNSYWYLLFAVAFLAFILLGATALGAYIVSRSVRSIRSIRDERSSLNKSEMRMGIDDAE